MSRLRDRRPPILDDPYSGHDHGDETSLPQGDGDSTPLMSELDRDQHFGAIPVKSSGCMHCGTPLDFDGSCQKCEPDVEDAPAVPDPLDGLRRVHYTDSGRFHDERRYFAVATGERRGHAIADELGAALVAAAQAARWTRIPPNAISRMLPITWAWERPV